MRLRLLALVLLVIAATTAGFVLTRVDSSRDAWLVGGTGLALTAVAGLLALPRDRQRQAMPEVERYFKLAPEMVILAGFDGYWKRVNPTFEALLGYTEREALGRPFMEFIHPDDRERSEEQARHVLEGATIRAFENRMLCKDGSHKWIEWTVTPVPEERVMYGVGRDVTERRRSEREQVALQRIATLVAQEVPQAEVFGAIAEEIGGLLGTEEVRMLRFDSDSSAVVVGGLGNLDAFPLGSRLQLEGDSVALRVRRTGRPSRFDDYRVAAGPDAETARSIGVRAVVGVPVFVERRLWGAISTGSTHDGPLPPDAEARLNEFTKLMATAIANGEARAEVHRLADEQAALRRVATLVAEAAPPAEISSAVSNEVATLFRTEMVVVGKFDGDPAALLAVAVGDGTDEPVVGSRWKLDEALASTAVYRTGLPARRDEDSTIADPDIAAIVERFRPVATVAVPITVEGMLWGAMIVSTRDAPLPTDTEERLQRFTDLIATALANAEARAEVERLAEEQATLRRLAVLVAQQPSPDEVFKAVTEAIGLLLDADLAVLHVFPGDGTATTVASWGGDGPMLPAGTRFPLDGDSLAARIFESGAPARMYSYEEAWERAATVLAQRLRVRSAVGAPILVEGKLWGALMAATRRVEPWAENAETRIAAFTELVATAIANAESREARAVLTEEQAALRRVATLVAQDAAPAEIFAAVSAEVDRVFRLDPATFDVAVVGRFEPGPELEIVGISKNVDVGPLGSRWPPDDLFAPTHVLRTGRSARIRADDVVSAGGEVAEFLRDHGYLSQVASPIVVDGRLWGAMLVTTRSDLPPDSEERLERFTELVATAIANAESSAELAASRRRIVAASDDARRRIERDLHDGVQQQLVSLGLVLGAMHADPPSGDVLKQQLASVTEDVGSALNALVEIARGIHPAILSEGGLAAALRGLARRSAVPIQLDAQIEGALPDEIEVAAYYVAAEALTNVAKHARASFVHIGMTTGNGTLTLIVRDDGLGGANPGGGTGLVGLHDRVEALGGTITIDSSAGNGTCVAVALPIAPEQHQDIEKLLGPPRELESPPTPA